MARVPRRPDRASADGDVPERPFEAGGWTVMNEAEARLLVLAVEAQAGRPQREWRATVVGALGWVFASVGVRSNQAYAVTPSGRIGSFMISTTPRDVALARLAGLPDSPSTRLGDGTAGGAQDRITVVRLSG